MQDSRRILGAAKEFNSVKLIEWDERLSIDKGVIDEDHQKLIEIINRFLKKDGKYESAQELVDILDELDA